jgi:transcriptional regulator with GAF, ATPase, and Fis domain
MLKGSSATIEMAVERSRSAVVLLITSGDRREQRLLAPGDELRLGSGAACDVRFADATVSALHCVVRHRRGVVEVVDQDSTNGVVVCGVMVGSARLAPGMSFEIGASRVDVEPLEDPDDVGSLAMTLPLPGLIGRSSAMRRLAGAVRRAAPLRLPALIRGESGTGKELVARTLHDLGSTPGGPFVVLNAATLSRDLADSELFGHDRGAFTGAARARRGAFREAHKGTLFLDEIGALGLDVQAKLLRVVEDGMVRPLGAERPVAVDVRLVVATCEPLEEMVAEQRFRRDLYERLCAVRIHVPALRDRRGDIPALVTHILATSGLQHREISAEAMAILRSLPYEGNVRELRNVVLQAGLRANDRIEASHLSAALAERALPGRRRIVPREAVRLLEIAEGNVSRAARLAAIPRSTLRDLLRAAQGEQPSASPHLALDQNVPMTPTP